MPASSQPEPLLRSPVEYAVGIAHASIAVLLLLKPSMLLLPPLYTIPLATACAALAALRFWQGLHLHLYQWRMSQSRRFTIPKIKSETDRIYFGRGFKWQQRHVQRLKETRTDAARRYLKFTDDSIGDPALHGVGLLERERAVYTSVAERNGHMLILGATRSGKTRLAELLISQDINRNDTVIVLDPKGDNELLRRIHHEAHRAGRQQDLHIIHLRYPELSQSYNPIASYHSPAEIASRIAGQLPGSGESEAFKQFAWRFLNSIATALDALNETPTYVKVGRYIENFEPLLVQYFECLFETLRIPNWRSDVLRHSETIDPTKIRKTLSHCDHYTLSLIQFYKKSNATDPIADDLMAALGYDKVYYDKITASLRPLLEKMRSDRLAPILSPPSGDAKTVEWSQAFTENSIVYIALDALASPDIAHAVGNAMFADLASAVGRLYADLADRPPVRRVCIHADEFARIVGPHLHPMLSMAGGAQVQITAYTQTLADIEAAFDGSRSHSARIIGNFNSVIMLRVRTEDTAKVLANQTPIVDVVELAQSESVADSSHPESDVAFTSSSSLRLATRSMPSLAPADLMRLPKGEAFALIESGIWKLRIPLIADTPSTIPIESILAGVS